MEVTDHKWYTENSEEVEYSILAQGREPRCYGAYIYNILILLHKLYFENVFLLNMVIPPKMLYFHYFIKTDEI